MSQQPAGIWDDIVAQPRAVAALQAAVAAARAQTGELLAGAPAEGLRPAPAGSGQAMSHAWLITGPPGSGRSNLALRFAASLQCPQGGCGDCPTCKRVLLGVHPDVLAFVPEQLTITKAEALELIHRASLHAAQGHWNVIIIEDADRLNDISGNMLLKEIEEPNRFTVWILCAPTSADVLPTIVSRTRSLVLATPTVAEVAAALREKFGVEPAMAAFAARAAQGHIGRARALASDERVRVRRHEVLRIPGSLRNLGACFTAATNLQQAAAEDAAGITDALDAAELAEVQRVFGEAGGTATARSKRAMSGMVRDLEARQRSRRTRTVRDQLDRALLDLTAFYRDVLVQQVGAQVSLVNEEMRPEIEALASHSDAAATLNRLDALAEARLSLAAAVAPLLALEALMVRLVGG
jgi:DNA polymerase-3 subunit delta'